jgi:hypothetical protein
LYVSETPSPVAGSARAETSATVLFAHAVSCCHAGFGSSAEHPLPLPFHVVSVQPRVVPAAFFSVVPPTAVTCGSVSGEFASTNRM